MNACGLGSAADEREGWSDENVIGNENRIRNFLDYDLLQSFSEYLFHKISQLLPQELPRSKAERRQRLATFCDTSSRSRQADARSKTVVALDRRLLHPSSERCPDCRAGIECAVSSPANPRRERESRFGRLLSLRMRRRCRS